jgi:hypothetical protein
MKREMFNTINPWLQNRAGCAISAIMPLAMVAILAATAAYPVLAQSVQRTFPSAADAGQDLFKAVQGNDEKAINNILGGPTDLTSAGDEAQDKADREMFVQKFREMHRVGRDADGSMTLYIGAENWPFPIPLVEKNGVWRFDPDAGQKEVLFRRIGDNELTAIAACHEFLADEKQNRTNPDALKTPDGFPASLVSKAGDKSGGAERSLYHGYYFHVLAGRPNGGFAMIAYPAEYRSSGVMTFVVTDKGLVYEKDLGANTLTIAGAMTTFLKKDASWHNADE